MPSQKEIEVLIEKSWHYCKIVFAVGIVLAITFGMGTFYPNKIATKRVNADLDNFYVIQIQKMDFKEPSFNYTNDIQFVRAMHKCIDYINLSTPKNKRIPYEMVIGQAALESGWGKSRFALKGNNLFGIRTYTESTPHLLPEGIDEWPGWGVRSFASKCASVKEYFRLLNEHQAYEDFRRIRKQMIENNQMLDSIKLIKTLDKFSTTKDYDERVIRMINKIKKLEENQ